MKKKKKKCKQFNKKQFKQNHSNQKQYSELHIKRINNSKHIKLPTISDLGNCIQENVNINTDLNVQIKKFNNNIINKRFTFKNDILKNEPIKTLKYKLLPNEQQKLVFQKWFLAYIDAYNLVIKKIKDEFKKQLTINKKFKIINLKIDLNINNLKKEFSINKSNISDKSNINMHILDYAIGDAIAMFKSKISNLKNGHVKKTQIRYLKRTKSNKIFKIENYLCKHSTFCPSELGQTIKTCPQIDFKNEINIVGIIQYNKHTNEYSLLVRKRIMNKTEKETNDYNKSIQLYDNCLHTSKEYLKLIKSTKKTDINCDPVKNLNKQLNSSKRKLTNDYVYSNEVSYKRKQSTNANANANTKIVAIDPGIRTFLTGVSNDHTIEIGSNIGHQIKHELKFIDKITNNDNLDNLKKTKLLLKTRNKLKNKINDYHWKIINHLICNYNHILIGNFSTKSMGESNMYKMTKRIGNNIRLYTFKQYLQYKCYLNGIKYTEINEYCTSKCCSTCGNLKKDLGSNKIYTCNKCGLNVNRDINAAKNILLKGIK